MDVKIEDMFAIEEICIPHEEDQDPINQAVDAAVLTPENVPAFKYFMISPIPNNWMNKGIKIEQNDRILDKQVITHPIYLSDKDGKRHWLNDKYFEEASCQKNTNIQKSSHDEIAIGHRCFHTAKRQVTCELCNKKFHCQVQLLLHVRNHEEEKTFKCDLCGSMFYTRQKLTSHQISSHIKIRVYPCDICERTFRSSTDLSRHKFIHTGIKPFKCELCDKAFSQKQHLDYHMSLHTNMKSFACNQCTKKFTRKCDLGYHMRKHTGERPYKCKFCEKSYMLKHHLTNHVVHIHNK